MKEKRKTMVGNDRSRMGKEIKRKKKINNNEVEDLGNHRKYSMT